MSTIVIVGAGIYFASHGLRGLPDMSLIGCVGMIIGGLVVIIGSIV